MKKIYIMSVAVLLTACSGLTNTGTISENTSVKTKMKACLISEADTRFQAGTLFNNSISSTAQELVSACIKKLVVQSESVSEESQSMAETIISNLKNFGGTAQ